MVRLNASWRHPNSMYIRIDEDIRVYLRLLEKIKGKLNKNPVTGSKEREAVKKELKVAAGRIEKLAKMMGKVIDDF